MPKLKRLYFYSYSSLWKFHPETGFIFPKLSDYFFLKEDYSKEKDRKIKKNILLERIKQDSVSIQLDYSDIQSSNQTTIIMFAKKSCSYLSWILFIVFVQLHAYAQKEVQFSNLTLENGLSQNSVLAICQDNQQFLWFGTKHGLNRYDGYQFKIYRNIPSVPGSLSSSSIQYNYIDSRGDLWIGTSKGLNKYDRQKDNFTRFLTNSKDKTAISNNSIEYIYEDKNQNLWIGTYKGLNKLDRETNTFQLYSFKDTLAHPNQNSITAILMDNHGFLWVGSTDGLMKVRFENGHMQYQLFQSQPGKTNGLSSSYITSIAMDAQQNIWIGTDNGINLYHNNDQSFTSFTHSNKDQNSIVHNDIRTIALRNDGMLWIGTQEGLSILDPANKNFTNYQHDPELKWSIAQNSVHSIFQDISGTMWVGTYYGGVNFAYPYSTAFKVQQNNKQHSSLSSNVISSIVEDEQHNLWIGTEGGGLNYYNRFSQTYTHYKNKPTDHTSLTSNLVKTIYRNKKGDLLIGTHHGGLNFFDPGTKTFRHINNVKNYKNDIGTAEIIAINEDSYGNTWIGSLDGLNLLKKVNGRYAEYTVKSPLEKSLKNKSIQILFEDQQRKLWIGTAAGLHRYDPQTGKLSYFLKNPADINRLQSDYINCIAQSTNGDLWIGTHFEGISRYSSKTNHFKTYTEKDGLSNNNVLGIVEDQSGNLWISTDNGLSKLDPKTGKFRNYTRSDGLAGNEFNVRSFFKDSKGEFYFGGYNGLTTFFPDQIEINKSTAPIVFTGLKLFNQPVDVNGPDKLLKEDINSQKEITFAHDQNHFTIGFALLNYIKSDKNRYAYKLEGYEKDWTYVHTPSATYTNLPPGEYVFTVKGINNDGIPGKGSVSIKIKIRPPIWASWWAYFAYLLIFSVILFLVVRYLFIKALLKRSVDLQQMKLDFFTNISHEIRTPLTLILTPLENLLKNTQDNLEISRQIIPIKNNADRLMRLITELMDFRKAETGHLKLYVSSDNIIIFCKEIFLAFQHVAIEKNITYNFESSKDSIEIFFDRKQLEKVLFNLLSNAFKFTKDNGTITLRIIEHKDEVQIQVHDNGAGISYENQNKLFSSFFQVDDQGSSHIGSGIGLALSKSIVEAHHGAIDIESIPATTHTPGDTCFTVKLKKGKTHFKSEEFAVTRETYPVFSTDITYNPASTDEDHKKDSSNNEHILIIEDNAEIRQLLAGSVGQHYQVSESIDGLKGWETAIELLPDLIICDVMMPVMDGLELCRKLKTDERTSHIPVILLTARSSHIHQVTGLETGADAYIMKPFSMELLELNIKNLIHSRDLMRRKYGQQITLQPQNIQIGSTDQAFITKVINYIEAHMSEQSFGVPDLASETGMSQPVLYKKIRAITDLSVNDFIKSIRLKRAVQLLEQKSYTISEISYLIGFNDPKYYSKKFKKQYEKTPREFMNELKNNNL